jgi:hypothetical protein
LLKLMQVAYAMDEQAMFRVVHALFRKNES